MYDIKNFHILIYARHSSKVVATNIAVSNIDKPDLLYLLNHIEVDMKIYEAIALMVYH
jgi:hypothetical protein